MVKNAEDCMGGGDRNLWLTHGESCRDFSQQLKEEDELFTVSPFIKLVSLRMQTREMMDLTSLLSIWLCYVIELNTRTNSI